MINVRKRTSVTLSFLRSARKNSSTAEHHRHGTQESSNSSIEMDGERRDASRARLLRHRSAMATAEIRLERTGTQFEMGFRQRGSVASESDHPEHSTRPTLVHLSGRCRHSTRPLDIFHHDETVSAQFGRLRAENSAAASLRRERMAKRGRNAQRDLGVAGGRVSHQRLSGSAAFVVTEAIFTREYLDKLANRE